MRNVKTLGFLGTGIIGGTGRPKPLPRPASSES
jgi:hypothetical protein